MNQAIYQDILSLATQLAHEAVDMAASYLGKAATSIKADHSVVTEADNAIQAHIVRQVAKRFPDHAFIGEESIAASPGAVDPLTAQFTWVVDPIDGTRNFVAGFPSYATSIGVLEQSRPVVAVVHEHTLNRSYSAVKGDGVKLNGQPISVVTPSTGTDLLIAGPSSKDQPTTHILQHIITSPGLIYRNVGSSAMHLAMVADGCCAGAFAHRCKLWDIAAGLLLVEEAGGTVTHLTGELLTPFDLTADKQANIPFVAGNPRDHKLLLDITRPIFS